MPKTSKEQATEHVEAEGFEGHYQELDGYTSGSSATRRMPT